MSKATQMNHWIGLTEAQKETVAEVAANATEGIKDGSATVTLHSISAHVATVDEMDEPSRYGMEGVSQADGTLAYPVAAIITEVREDFRTPSAVTVERVARRVDDAMNAAFRVAVTAEVGDGWTGDTMAGPDLEEAVRSVARDLLENGLPPVDHDIVSLVDADGNYLRTWERH